MDSELYKYALEHKMIDRTIADIASEYEKHLYDCRVHTLLDSIVECDVDGSMYDNIQSMYKERLKTHEDEKENRKKK